MSKTTAEIRAGFRARLAKPEIVVAPGVHDAISALLAEQAGFEAVFFAGSAMAVSHLGRTDVGLLTLAEIAAIVQRAADRVSIPIMVDVDSAFGAAPHAARAMQVFERAGAAGVQVEDQQVVKPNDALLSRPLVPVAEMQAKIRAMVDVRESPDMLLSARTDAKDPDELVERLLAYREAGADLVFPEGTTDTAVLRRLREQLGDGVPLVYNNHYPDAELTGAAGLEGLGVSLALFPVHGVRASVLAMRDAFAALAADPDLAGGGRHPMRSADVDDILDSGAYLARFR